MAKKNFDDFVLSAGKRNRPSPEEVDELSQILHAPKSVLVEIPKIAIEKSIEIKEKPQKIATESKKQVEKTQKQAVVLKNSDEPLKNRKIVGKEKIRVTVDLEKELYRKLKMHVIVEETDLSTYLRRLLVQNLPK
jgi:ElaB/YqjD/DUF883 family membrane-anchored ribosome-binding protein